MCDNNWFFVCLFVFCFLVGVDIVSRHSGSSNRGWLSQNGGGGGFRFFVFLSKIMPKHSLCKVKDALGRIFNMLQTSPFPFLAYWIFVWMSEEMKQARSLTYFPAQLWEEIAMIAFLILGTKTTAGSFWVLQAHFNQERICVKITPSYWLASGRDLRQTDNIIQLC